jgi:quercetin dioxygenase-like cupin family protein/iron-sulfur cluster repair protein YtfE (RIC family)
MKRHPSLVPLSHDHHHALVEARRLRRAADGPDEERRRAATSFLRFFSTETIRHFREEEERLFPILADHEEARELLVRALLEHQRIHALVTNLDRARDPTSSSMRELADTLEAHVRLEERQLFPLIEQVVGEEALDGLDVSRGAPGSPVIDLLEPLGSGPLWGAESDELNATLLSWRAGEGPREHVNTERDVAVVVLAGSATVSIDGEPHPVRAGEALIVEKGRRRSIAAGPEGVRYLSVHRRRGPLQIAPLRSGGEREGESKLR